MPWSSVIISESYAVAVAISLLGLAWAISFFQDAGTRSARGPLPTVAAIACVGLLLAALSMFKVSQSTNSGGGGRLLFCAAGVASLGAAQRRHGRGRGGGILPAPLLVESELSGRGAHDPALSEFVRQQRRAGALAVLLAVLLRVVVDRDPRSAFAKNKSARWGIWSCALATAGDCSISNFCLSSPLPAPARPFSLSLIPVRIISANINSGSRWGFCFRLLFAARMRGAIHLRNMIGSSMRRHRRAGGRPGAASVSGESFSSP